MLFGRGVWSVFGIRKSSQASFEAAIQGEALANASQAAAHLKDGEFGINPFEFPRLDEQYGVTDSGNAPPEFTADLLRLGDGTYGFWGVVNGADDLTDPKSKQEALAYRDASKPFKFLTKDEKKVIEQNVVAEAVASRTQFPVLIDFNGEAVYVASGNVDQVGFVRAMVADLGGEVFDLSWQFGSADWTRDFLKRVNDLNKFDDEMASRADELSRFRKEEVEKLDDRMTESVVSTYFAMSELSTGQWAGLATPARIKMYSSSDPVSASSPSTAFQLMRKFEAAQVAAASVVFQSIESRFNKRGEERQVRIDLFTIDVNDNVNLGDAGAAMLRGFDIPTFKRDMKMAAKNNGGSIPVSRYWKEWLSSMKTAVNTFVDNVTDTLEIDKHKFGLKPFTYETKEQQ